MGAEASIRRDVASVIAEETAGDGTEETEENGLRVVYGADRFWCAQSGSVAGFCWDERPRCNKVSKSCAAASAVARLGVTARTSGEETSFCRTSYGACSQLRAQAELSQEYEVADCVIFRYRKKR